MKNLSEYRDGPSASRVPRSGGHDPFRFRKRVTDHGQKMRAEKEWKRHNPEEYRAARLRKLMLGRLPGRMAKYGCADFDLSDISEYTGDDGVAARGGELAAIAAHIVRCAKHPVDYLFSLRGVPAKLVEPIKAYLRVKLAMGRLRSEIENATRSLTDDCPLEVPHQVRDDRNIGDAFSFVISAFAQQTSKTSRGQYGVEEAEPLNAPILSATLCPYEVPDQVRDDRIDVLPRGSVPTKPQPSFKWHTSPAKTHNFKELTAAFGYDPRETSVYWIEKRAASLRRKWKKHGQQMRGESFTAKPKAKHKTLPLPGADHPPEVKHFLPADIDYNSVWPPVKMPGGPPRAAAIEADKNINKNGFADPSKIGGLGEGFARPAEAINTVRDKRLDILRTAFEDSAVEAQLEFRHTASMSLLTRIFSAGARLFGPPPGVDPHGRPGQIEPAGVTAALIALGAKMAKSDGVVTTDEIDAFKRVFQAAPEDEPMIGRFFDLARQTTAGFERYAAIIAKRYRAQPAALEDVLDGLFHIALADSVVTDDEMDFLRRVSEVFGFSALEFNRIKAAHVGRADDDPYLILGIDERVTDSELKRAYRRMAAANHPDRLMARGLPQELIGLANHKMSMINKAYEEIKRQRKSILPKLHGPGS